MTYLLLVIIVLVLFDIALKFIPVKKDTEGEQRMLIQMEMLKAVKQLTEKSGIKKEPFDSGKAVKTYIPIQDMDENYDGLYNGRKAKGENDEI